MFHPNSTIHGTLLEEERRYKTFADWPQKHRPSSLEEMALPPDLAEQMQAWLREPMLPFHVVIHGVPGNGKTSLANVIANRYYGSKKRHHVRIVKAAQSRSIDTIREFVEWLAARGGLFAKVDPDWTGLGIFSEADGLTPEAQNALKDALDDYGDRCRCIFTTNRLESLDRAIRSRCEVLTLDHTPAEQRTQVLARVLDREELEVDEETMSRFAANYPDLRRMLREAQTSMATYGKLIVLGNRDGAKATEDTWPTPVDGEQLFKDLRDVFQSYLSLIDGAAEALALWVLFAHAHDAFVVSPILAITSPVKRAGKTTLLHLLARLVPNPLHTSNITAAALYRSVEALRPSLVADEADAWFRQKDEIRGVWNSGHVKDGATVARADGPSVAILSTWCPKVLALIAKEPGDLPSTVADRSIIVTMRRKTRGETVRRLRLDRIADELAPFRQKAARWASDHFVGITESDPGVPEALDDRAADNWRPLLAVAELVGGVAVEGATRSAALLWKGDGESDEDGIQALCDLRELFDRNGGDRLPSRVVVEHFATWEDRPWGPRFTPRRLARLLRPFEIRPRSLWGDVDGHRTSMKGYFKEDCADAFARYTG